MHPFVWLCGMGFVSNDSFLNNVLRGWGEDAQEFVRIKLPHLVMVALIAFVLYRILKLITARMLAVAERHAAGENRVPQVKTLAGVIRATGLAIIAAIVGLQFLDALGVDLAPLLASAGVAGVAIGLAAQNIVRDVLNGVLILIEDQFNVGDTVKVAGVTGKVESMTLRKTTVRDADGTLYVIPNSQITTVANQSIDYSIATVNVSVDYSANPDDVMALLSSIAMDVHSDEKFRNDFVADPKILGVDAVRGSEMIFPVQFRTRPTKQLPPVREFRRRVRQALMDRHMLPGDPNRVFHTELEHVAVVQRRNTPAAATQNDATTQSAPDSNPLSSS
ncbi:MAG: mechanosensitive ion channel family protein [Acidobacteriota bacterium]|nr:mechanosensitive ion channel family protein [Acidobacteriota bacterium]